MLKAFPQATVHVEPDTEGIVEGIREMASKIERYKEEAVALKLRKLAEWDANAEALRNVLQIRNAGGVRGASAA